MEKENKCMSNCSCPCGMINQYIKNNTPIKILHELSKLSGVNIDKNLIILFKLFLFLIVISLFIKIFFNI